MRIPIRVQLGSLLLISSLIGLAVISIATWVTIHDFVLRLRAGRLSLIASLKAAQLASNIDVMQTSSSFVSSRIIIQAALEQYQTDGNNSLSSYAVSDLNDAVQGSRSIGQEILIQAVVYGRNGTGPGGRLGFLNATQSRAQQIELPYQYPNGTKIFLGADDTDLGFPPPLYPNLTYLNPPSNAGPDEPIVSYEDLDLRSNSTLLLGPWMVNETFSLISLTTAIFNDSESSQVVGWLTAVMDSYLILSVLESSVGLGETGETLLVGPATSNNMFPGNVITAARASESPSLRVRYVLPLPRRDRQRHPDQVIGSTDLPFNVTEFPTIYQALETAAQNYSDSSGSNIYATNEANQQVSVGYAVAPTEAVDWIILVEQSRSEVWQPITNLRNVILICLFSTIALMAVISYPLAHVASLPIIRLRKATARSVEASSTASRSSLEPQDGLPDRKDEIDEDTIAEQKKGFTSRIVGWRKRREENNRAEGEDRAKRTFHIPGKVKERKSWIKDELWDLTMTFNEMSDELMLQYSKLDERVRQRTAELELSKKAAEAANESKTLFIANISHELKTPLNGILGMCAVCMQEDDPIRLKRSLGIIYKSGDLLLNLLTDLLTFSKNQVGQSLSLDEKEFRLKDISTQILAIFEKQATEGQIDLRVEFGGMPNSKDNERSPERIHDGSSGIGKMPNMILWGDVHRILQVLINLVSNALKFTPSGGSVVLTVRCLPGIVDVGSRKSSTNSRRSRQRSSCQVPSDGTLPTTRTSTAYASNARDRPHTHAHAPGTAHELNNSPPPGIHVYFEFEVADTGPGIPELLQEKIFQPFVQGDLRLSKKYGGTGLGLSICSQLAQLMRGTISVRSTVGLGSTFTVELPLRMLQSRADSTSSSIAEFGDGLGRQPSIDDMTRPATPAPGTMDQGLAAPVEAHGLARAATVGNVKQDSKPRLVGLSQPFFAASQPLESPNSQPAAMKQISAEAVRGGRIRVLVAEDNKVNQEVVLRMLKLEDIYDVTVAKDGQEALDLVKESMRGEDAQPFNLIFMDVQMPNVDGLQSTRLIREIGYQAPIVALTAFAEESNIKDCLDSGMNHFLSKPIRRPQLKKVLREYCAPIPEETEDLTPPEERRGSGVNMTIVMVNGPAKQSEPPAHPHASASSSTSPAVSLRDQPSMPALDDGRPVSPRCTS